MTATIPRPAIARSTPNQLAPGGDNDIRQADTPPVPDWPAPAGSNAQPAMAHPKPSQVSPAGADTRQARVESLTEKAAPAGSNTQPAKGDPTSIASAPVGADTRQARRPAVPVCDPLAGPNSRPTTLAAMPIKGPSGGAQLANSQGEHGAQFTSGVGDQPAGRQADLDAHYYLAAGSTSSGPATDPRSTPNVRSLLDPVLGLAADVLDDIERVRTANENRLRQLTRSVEDVDGEMRGFGLDESHPDVARLAGMVDMLAKVEADAVKNLQRQMRHHPLYGWAKAQRGVGDKQVARLLALIGDPYVRPEIVREDGTVLPEGPRTVSALWAYCGLHVLPAGQATIEIRGNDAGRDQQPADQLPRDAHRSLVGGAGGDPGQDNNDTHASFAGVAPKRARGQKANWSTKAKTKAYLIAESCAKQLIKPCAKADETKWAIHVDGCTCSVYRVVYDIRRAHTAGTRPDWTDGHSHNDALRVVSKAILRDLWRAARDWHLERA